ncbi:bacteriocin [Alsobacter sp. R-9]
MKKVVAVCAVALSLAACSGTGSVQGDRALTGAAIGGAGGALIGGLASNSVGGAVAGGVIGAAGGAIIGAATAPKPKCYYDNQGRRYCRR